MNLSVDPRDPTPPYEQLRRQLADLVATGALPAGDRLPPLRQLARVAERSAADPAAERQTRLRELAQAYLLRARALGCSEAEIRDAIRTQGAPGT